VANVIKVDFRTFCLALLARPAEEKEVSPRAAHYGGRFDGKLKNVTG
jgi:hypothetical protein